MDNIFTGHVTCTLPFVFFEHKALYKSDDLCPSTNQTATRGVPTTICCPVRGFPPPEVTWKLPNGTVIETGNTILSITPKTKEDFGKYTCSTAGLKETFPDPIVVPINLGEEGQSKYIFDMICLCKVNYSNSTTDISQYRERFSGNHENVFVLEFVICLMCQ